jgi:hypothetical protein
MKVSDFSHRKNYISTLNTIESETHNQPFRLTRISITNKPKPIKKISPNGVREREI